MKHIGIVACGAEGAEGAALSYHTIRREALTLVGRHDHPRITLDTIPMARWLPAFDAEDYAGAAFTGHPSGDLECSIPRPHLHRKS